MKAGSFVPASDIEATFIDGLYPCFGGNGLRGYTSTFTHEGTYPLIGRQGALCGNINLVDGKFYATEHAIVVMPTPLIDVYWLRYLLQGLNLNEYAAGAAQPGLSVEKLTKLKLALPPYEEQIRIANILQASFHITEDVDKYTSNLKYIIQQTKSKILNLALQGKLVPQDPNDEPASMLLKRIREERTSQLTSKKTTAKTAKNIPSTTDDNSHYPFDIPSTWAWCRVGDIVQVIGGVSFSKNDMCIDGIRILRGGNIQNCEIRLCHDDVYLPAQYQDRNNTIISGDVVVVASTGSSQLVGKAGFAKQDMPNTQIGAFLRIVRPNVKQTERFLWVVFESEFYREYIRNIAKGTNINNIKNEYITNFVIPLPPINEQQRISKEVTDVAYMIETIAQIIEA